MKKWYIILAGLLTIMSFKVFASEDVQVKLEGAFDFQTGFMNQKLPSGVKKFNENNDSIAFNTSSDVALVAEHTNSYGLTYGAKIALQTHGKSSRGAQTMGFIEGPDYGRFEFGSGKSVYSVMKIHGYSVCCNAAGEWDSWFKQSPVEGRNIEYITSYGNYLDAKVRNKGMIEYPRKVSYYTPKFRDFQFGVSYIPDTANVGHLPMADPDEHKTKPGLYGDAQKIDVKNAFALGVSHDLNINEYTSIKSSVVYEHGKAINKNLENADYKLKDLNSYVVGSEIHYKKFDLALSYGNHMKSFTSKAKDGNIRNSYLYSVGAGYQINNRLKASINHLHSNHKKNKLNATTLGLDYKFAPGFLPYAEVTYVKANGRYKEENEIKREKRNATILLIGAKLKF